MFRAWRAQGLWGSLLACGLVACTGGVGGVTGEGADGGHETDGGAATDGGSSTDGGPATDGGTANDGGIQTDGGASTDGGAVDASACPAANVLCVDDTTGAAQEYSTIQAAVDAAVPGDTVLVFAGSYAGFRIEHSGTSAAPITVRAAAGVQLTSPESLTHNFIRIQNSSYWTIEGFHLTGSGTPQPYDYDYACIAARGATSGTPMHGLVLRANEVSGCSPSAMYLSQTEGLLLEDNFIHHNVLEQQNGNGNGVYLANAGTDNVVVRHNRFIANAGSGIHFNGDASVTGADGLQKGHLFDRNLVADNGGNGFNMDGIQDCVFVNNVFANNGHHGVRGFDIDAAAGPKNNVFINNTFVGNIGAGVKMSEDQGGHVLFNNLTVNNIEGGIAIGETTPAVSNNVDSSTVPGVFLDASAADFRLPSGSPAVNAGVAVFAGSSAPAIDFNGFARTVPPDCGAFELGSAP